MEKVLIIDDHPLIRRGLKGIITEKFGDIPIVEASDSEEALKSLNQNDFDIVLLDITLKSGSGFEVLSNIQDLYPKTPVLVISMHPEEQYAIRMFKAGSSGYVTKDRAPEELVTAIIRILNGGKYISAALAEKIAFELNPAAEQPDYKDLSNREFQVMCMIARGMTVQEIADELSLSAQTVRTYRSRMMRKLNLRNNSEITYYAIKNGLIS